MKCIKTKTAKKKKNKYFHQVTAMFWLIIRIIITSELQIKTMKLNNTSFNLFDCVLRTSLTNDHTFQIQIRLIYLFMQLTLQSSDLSWRK